MLRVVGVNSLDQLIAETVPEAIRQETAARFRPSAIRTRRARSDAGHCQQEPRADVADRPGLPRHDHAACHSTQHPRESGLVYRLYPLSSRDQPGASRSASELPDACLGSHSARYRQRLASGRGNRSGRGDGACAPRHEVEGHRLLRRRGVPAANDSRAQDTRGAARLANRHRRPVQGFGRRERFSARFSNIRAYAAPSTTSPGSSRSCMPPRRSPSLPPTLWRSRC